MDGKMKVAVMTAPKTMEWLERDIPETGENQVLIKLSHVGICGSDLHFYEEGRLGNWIPKEPLTLGHEPGGTVVEVGKGVSSLKVGDKVAIEPGVPCGVCEYCKKGLYNLCDNMSFMAIPEEREGVFSEYCAHPANMCYKLPDNMDTMEGALIEPLAVGFHAVQKSGAKVGQSALVLGCGCIGLVTIMVLKACGISNIYATDIIDRRLQKAKEVGAIEILYADKMDVVEYINSLPGGGVDLVFETAGNKITTLQTAKMIKKGGSVTLVGMTPDSEINYDIGTLMSKEAQLHTVFRYRNLYPTAIEAVSQGDIPLKSIVSHVFDFKDVIEAMDFNSKNKNEVIKAVIKY